MSLGKGSEWWMVLRNEMGMEFGEDEVGGVKEWRRVRNRRQQWENDAIVCC